MLHKTDCKRRVRRVKLIVKTLSLEFELYGFFVKIQLIVLLDRIDENPCWEMIGDLEQRKTQYK